MSTTQAKPSKEPEIRVWECQADGLPLAPVRAYGRLQAASEYRHIYRLHESRKVEVKEIS